MALLTELFTDEILKLDFNAFKQFLKSYKFANSKNKKILLQEYAVLNNIKLTKEDYNFIE